MVYATRVLGSLFPAPDVSVARGIDTLISVPFPLFRISRRARARFGEVLLVFMPVISIATLLSVLEDRKGLHNLQGTGTSS